MSGDTFDFVQGGVVTSSAQIVDNAATVGDVLTVQADKSIAAAAGGGFQTVNVYDLGTVTITDFETGQVTLPYTPAADDLIGPVFLRDVVLTDVRSIGIGRPEGAPSFAAWDNDTVSDGYDFAVDKALPVTATAIKASLAVDLNGLLVEHPNWVAATAYAQFDEIIAAGHRWYADPGGTSGGSQPDFAGNIGGTVADNTITWNDSGAAAGSAHVYAVVMTPATP